jgi:glutathione transport system permease protein
MLPLIVLGVSAIIFFSIRLLPGDPARLMAGPDADASSVTAMRERLGLNRPVLRQYGEFLVNAVQGDLGESIKSKQPVSEELARRFPYTFRLALAAYGLAIVFGISFGLLAAVNHSTWIDSLVMLFAIIGASTANFWLALMAMDLFSVKLGWLPLLGAGTWKHYVLPTLALGVFPTALVARMTRSSMLEVINQDYIRTARAKGLIDSFIYRKHALRNALIPIVTVVGLNFGVLLGGAVVTETVFSWPGMGRLLIDSVRFRDYPVIQAVVLVTVITVILTNFLVDLLIAAINPRIRFD